MFTDIILREPQAYKCGLWLGSLSEDRYIKILICLRVVIKTAANMWKLNSYSFKGYCKPCFHIIVREHMYHENCYPLSQQKIHISVIRFLR